MRVPNLTITDVVLENHATGLAINGDGMTVEIDGLSIIDTPIAVAINGSSKVSGKGLTHTPKAEAPQRAKKYFSGFSFSKGDHLKKD